MNDWFVWMWVLLAAPFVGSFLGLLIRRLPAGAPVAFARSNCESCGVQLAARDLVPIASWLTLGRHCRYCGSPLGVFYPGIETAALGVAVWAAVALPDTVLVWTGCLLGWSLLGAAVTDFRHLVLPDVLVVPLIPAGILVHMWIVPDQWMAHVTGAAIGYLAFAAVAMIYRAVRQRDGLGMGDAKLSAAAGAWVGWMGLPSVILLGAVFGLLTVLVLRVKGREVGQATELPFGPALALAFWLVWLYGPLVPA